MGENGDAVEGTVVLRVVQPALEAMWAVATNPNPNDVGGTAHPTRLLTKRMQQVCYRVR